MKFYHFDFLLTISCTVLDSYILMPNHIIVNKLAVGGNQAAKESMPVDAASTSSVSFDCSSSIISSFYFSDIACVV